MATNVLVDALVQQRQSLAIYTKRRPRSIGWPPRRSSPGSWCTRSWLLRVQALLARAQGDDAAYRDHRDRYRKMVTELGFEGHMAMAEAMD